MSRYYHIMPVDLSTIRTRIRIHPGLRAAPKAFILAHGLSVKAMKPSRGKSANGPTWNLALDVLAYKGIKVKLTQIDRDPLATVNIDFNPGKCLYGDNGRILLLTEFLEALAVLVTHLTPLLCEPKDWVDLVPGLRRGGVAYWSYLEIPFQCRDFNGTLLARLRNLRHPSVTTPSRHWPDSIKVGPHRGKLRLSIYRKPVEMAKRHIKGVPLLSDEKLAVDRDILRLEARMKEEKLVHYLGNGHNVEVIDGKERLVSFFPQDLIRGHRACFGELLGVFLPTTSPKDKRPHLSALGRMIAEVANDAGPQHTFPELIDLIKHYTGAPSETIGPIRSAGLAELTRRSPISSGELFSDAAYAAQFGVASDVAEQLVYHEFEDTVADRMITKTYRPPGQPFHPHIELPGYTLRRTPYEG